MTRSVCILVVVTGLAMMTAARAAPAPRPVPVEFFTRLPAIEHVTLSPAGTQIAYFKNRGPETVLVVRAAPAGAEIELVDTRVLGHEFNWFRWVGEQRLLLSLRVPHERFGIPTEESRMLVIEVPSGATRPLFMTRRRQWVPQYGDQVVHVFPDDPDHVLLAVDLAKPTELDVYKIDLRTGRRHEVVRRQPNIHRWLADTRGEVRIGVGIEDTRLIVIGRRAGARAWRTLWSFDLVTSAGPSPIGFGADPNVLYVAAPHQGRYAVFAADLEPEVPRLTLVAADPHYDVRGVAVQAPASHDIGGVYYHAEAGKHAFWNARLAALQAEIDSRLPGYTNRLTSLSRDERRAIVFASRARAPGTHYLFDRDSGALTELGASYPELAAVTLAGKETVRYTSRDGLSIEGYLTRPPPGGTGPLPLVVLPHGGPGFRDTTGFDYWSEFLASRGYAVLQVNYRGSTGYGIAFQKAGYRNWGKAMQHDVTDGVRWAIDAGIADPARICIVGASYGGYAALMGAIQTPDLYRCAVSFAAVTDLELFRENYRYFRGHAVMAGQIGTDPVELAAVSPARLAAGVRIPLLIAHGSEDRIVPVTHADRLVDGLAAARAPFSYLRMAGADHYLGNPAHRTEMFTALGEFLATHLR